MRNFPDFLSTQQEQHRKGSESLVRTCVGDGQPPSQEVEGAIGGVGYVARQRLEVALRGQPAHKLGRVRVELAVVQRVRAVGQRVQQGPVAHGELASGVVARAQGALVAGGGGGEIGLDGEQMGILCVNDARGEGNKQTDRQEKKRDKKKNTDKQLCESL